jgi:hypothetical protein
MPNNQSNKPGFGSADTSRRREILGKENAATKDKGVASKEGGLNRKPSTEHRSEMNPSGQKNR